MHDPYLYTPEDINSTYNKVHDHLLTRYIIRKYSTNTLDIRDVAIDGLDFSNAKRVLDLGCGYGFFIEKLKGRLPADATIIGIDIVENNRAPYLHSVTSTLYKGEFIAGSVEMILETPSSSFDVIIASYSLYFFPHLLPEIARILEPDGIFLTVTHSKNTLGEAIRYISDCMNSLGIELSDGTAINRLFNAFSLEDGLGQLERYFDDVTRIDYMNTLLFNPDQIDDCLFYLKKKKSLVYKEVVEKMPDRLEYLHECVNKCIYEHVRKNGSLSLNKNDAVFRCFRPKKP